MLTSELTVISLFTKEECVLSCSVVSDSATQWTVALQSPLTMGILQAVEWVAMPSSRGIVLTQGSSPGLPHCRRILDHLSHEGSPQKRRLGFKEALC